MSILINSIAIFTALIIGIFIGSKTTAKKEITETIKKYVDKLRDNRAIITSPSQVFKKQQLKEELKQGDI